MPAGTDGCTTLVSLGLRTPDGTVVVVADPLTCTDVGEGRVGEIWVDGPSKVRGGGVLKYLAAGPALEFKLPCR